MKTSSNGLRLITSFEGYHTELPDGSCKAYLDKLAKPPVWTIGYGCTEGVKEGMVWSRKKAEAKLREELAKHERNVENLVSVTLNQNQFDALVSLSYNVGLSPTRTRTLLSRLNKGDYKGAGDAFLLYNKAGGKEYAGLTRRRKAEQALFQKQFVELEPNEVRERSGKLRLFKTFRDFIASLSIGSYVTWEFFGNLKEYVSGQWLVGALGVAGLLWLLAKYVDWKTLKDHAEKRYLPSGAIKKGTN